MANSDGDPRGDLFDADMGDATGGSVEFDKDGTGSDHTSVHGDGMHFSWNSDSKTGEVDKDSVHGTEHDKSGNKSW